MHQAPAALTERQRDHGPERIYYRSEGLPLNNFWWFHQCFQAIDNKNVAWKVLTTMRGLRVGGYEPTGGDVELGSGTTSGRSRVAQRTQAAGSRSEAGEGSALL